MSAKTLAVALAILAGSPGFGSAQTHQHSGLESHRERYTLPEVRVDQSPKIDGVLDDQVWAISTYSMRRSRLQGT